MSTSFAIGCPNCGSTTTVQTGVSKNGTGLGQCRNCHKTVKITVDHKGNVIRVS